MKNYSLKRKIKRGIVTDVINPNRENTSLETNKGTVKSYMEEPRIPMSIVRIRDRYDIEYLQSFMDQGITTFVDITRLHNNGYNEWLYEVHKLANERELYIKEISSNVLAITTKEVTIEGAKPKIFLLK